MIYAPQLTVKRSSLSVSMRRFQGISFTQGQEFSSVKALMDRDHSHHCDICDSPIGVEVALCPECELAFASAEEGEPEREPRPLDLDRYSCQMFPWERGRNQVRLISANPVWIFLALGLVLLVVLLALLRTPLPSCWELAS